MAVLLSQLQPVLANVVDRQAQPTPSQPATSIAELGELLAR